MSYTFKTLQMWWNVFLMRLNRSVLPSCVLIQDCARCRGCGRNVHDFHVPNDLWLKVIGSDGGVWCYDCFCDLADRKLGFKWRVDLVEYWNCH